jgi:hypothetical protein
MNLNTRALRTSFAVALCLAVISCGGGGGGGGLSAPSQPTGPTQPTAGSNVATVIVDAGPTPSQQPTINELFTTVTLCVPGSTTQCTTIDHVQVDTASFGFRVLAAALPSGFNLPVVNLPSGNRLLECTVFGDGYSWGPIARADFTISGESAASMPIQVIGDPNFLPAPSACSSQSTGGGEEDTVLAFGANAIIGIGVETSDCPLCAQQTGQGVYYSCSTVTACTETIVPVADIVPNPISLFATDNNGSILVLPAVAATGAATVTGSLIFGVDTQSNNQSGSQTVLFIDPNDAELTMVYKGSTLKDSFIDSGSNAIYFADSALTQCLDSKGNSTGFYCPASPQTLPLAIELKSGGNFNTSFNVVSANTIDSGINAFPSLAGSLPASLDGGFDWGLPFFFGRRVANVIAGSTTSVGSGPYIAF